MKDSPSWNQAIEVEGLSGNSSSFYALHPRRPPAGALALRLLLLLGILRGFDPWLPDFWVILRPPPGTLHRVARLVNRALQVVELILVEYQRIHKRVGHRVVLGQVLADYSGYPRRVVQLPQSGLGAR